MTFVSTDLPPTLRTAGPFAFLFSGGPQTVERAARQDELPLVQQIVGVQIIATGDPELGNISSGLHDLGVMLLGRQQAARFR